MGGGFFSTDTRDTLVESIQCSGTESTLRQCSYSAGYDEECIHDAAVICQGNCSSTSHSTKVTQHSCNTIVVIT